MFAKCAQSSVYHDLDLAGAAAPLVVVKWESGFATHSVAFNNDTSGQAIYRKEGGGPTEVWYRFGGKEIGYVGNNGSRDTDYAASIDLRTATQGTGLFFNGATTGTAYANFDIGVARLTSYDQGSSAGVHTVQSGDTLASIAAQLWGDASLWYKLAQANGMSANASLSEGQTLIIPAGINRATNNATTFNPYDPNDVLGNLAPTRVKPPNRKDGCGVMGQVILAVIAIAVTALTQNPILGDIVSQGVGVGTGLQDHFSWNAVALTALTAGIGRGIGDSVANAVHASSYAADIVSGAVNSAISQGVGVALHWQNKFSWAGVAAAGLGSAAAQYAGAQMSGAPPRLAQFGATLASDIVNSATRSLIDHSDFGDNMLAALPDALGGLFGGAVAGDIATVGSPIFGAIGHGLAAVGDFLGFDGSFGYQGPARRNMSLGGLGDAIGNVIAPPAAAASEPVLAGYGAYDFSAYGSLGDGVYRPGSDDGFLTLIGGGSRTGIGGNRPPPEFMTETAFPGLPGSPNISSILAPIDSFIGLNFFGLQAQARLDSDTMMFQAYWNLNRQLDPTYQERPQAPSFDASGPMGRQAHIASMREDLAIATYNLQRDTLSFVQRRADVAYAEGVRRYDAGTLGQNLSREEAIGNFMDRAVRRDVQRYYSSRGVSFGAGQYVTVNNRQYAADGSYRIPDAQIGRISMDWTLTPKTISTPQVQGIFNARSSPVGVIIIRPTQVGGSYYIPRPVATPQRR